MIKKKRNPFRGILWLLMLPFDLAYRLTVKYIYTDFVVVFYHYLKLTRLRTRVYEWLLPVLLAAGIFQLTPDANNSSDPAWKDFRGQTMNTVTVLLGFSIASFTILVTSSGESVEKLKSRRADADKSMTQYQEFLANYSYSIVAEICVILGNLLVPLLRIGISPLWEKVLNAFNLVLVIHILLLMIRMSADLYFTLFGNRPAPQ